jgi:hypothetical protein
VDNLWVGLWFACHQFERVGTHAHIVRAVPTGADDAVFLIAVVVNHGLEESEPGFYRSASARVIDLRKALPSFYVRPHANMGCW